MANQLTRLAQLIIRGPCFNSSSHIKVGLDQGIFSQPRGILNLVLNALDPCDEFLGFPAMTHGAAVCHIQERALHMMIRKLDTPFALVGHVAVCTRQPGVGVHTRGKQFKIGVLRLMILTFDMGCT